MVDESVICDVILISIKIVIVVIVIVTSACLFKPTYKCAPGFTVSMI